MCWFYMGGAGREQGRARSTLARIPPVDGASAVKSELRGERRRHLQIRLRRRRPARNHLRQRLAATVGDVDLGVAWKDWARDAEAGRPNQVAAGGVAVPARER